MLRWQWFVVKHFEQILNISRLAVVVVIGCLIYRTIWYQLNWVVME